MWSLINNIEISWGALLLFPILMILAYISMSSSWKRLPPGPPAFPIIGSLPFLRGDLRDVFSKMASKYGDIFTVYLGRQRIVVMNRYDVIKECLMTPGGIFDNRSKLWDSFGMMGPASINGPAWKEQRRYIQHFLRTFAQQSTSLEDIANFEASQLVAALASKVGHPCYLHEELTLSIANVISMIVMDRRFDHGDLELLDFLKKIDVFVNLAGPGNFALQSRLLRFLPGDPFGYHKALQTFAEQTQMAKQWIDKYRRKMQNMNTSWALIGQYSAEIENKKNEKDASFSDKRLGGVIGDIYGAGVDTTTSTLLWTLLYMVLNPHIQKKVQLEIDVVIGRDRQPVMQDRRNMDYTEAVLCEAMRLGDLIPLGVPRSTVEATLFRGYEIPKDTMIINNFNSISRDSDLWPQPEKFDPGRFLDADGKYQKRDELIPFAIGKRSCLGENLARMNMFLFFTNLLQRFNLRCPENHAKPSTAGFLGLSNRTKPFLVNISLR